MAIAHRARRSPDIDPRLPRAWELTIVVLTVLGLVVVALEWSLEVGSFWGRTAVLVDDVICGVFLLDFGVRLRRSSDRLAFMKRRWIDLVGAIPLIGPLRVIRVVRLLRIVRLWRASRVARRLVGLDSELIARAFGNLGVIALLLWAATGGLFFLFERGSNDSIRGIDDALWWSMTTLSTVGYGDIYPHTQAGRLVALLTMVLGVGVLGSLAATLAAAILDLRDRGRRGLGRYVMRDHLLVLGWNAKSTGALAAFRVDPRYTDVPIVVLADLETSPSTERGVRFVRGAPSQREALERASAGDAAIALIFARDPRDGRSDHESAITVLAVRKLNARLRIAVELVDSANRALIADLGCDAVVDAQHLAACLLVRGVQDVGVSEVVEDLLASETGSELYRVPLPSALVGHTFRECVLAFLDDRGAVIGIMRGRQRWLNPDNALVLEPGDDLFVVAAAPP